MKIIECPRDAMQGMTEFVPSEMKIEYINSLLEVGFDTIDFGSFVSPKAIPQMRDTATVLSGLNESRSKLLAIVANQRGARDACEFERIDYLGYPFSISEEFQKRNTNASIDQSLLRVEEIQELCKKNGKSLVIYISMAFGNPYNENWHPDIAIKWSERLNKDLGVDIIALSDTIGVSNPDNITSMLESVYSSLPDVEFGVHLHTTMEQWHEKVNAAWNAGCRRFDGALRGFGGCPMAKEDLTGNMPTEKMVSFFLENNIETGIDQKSLEQALQKTKLIFH